MNSILTKYPLPDVINEHILDYSVGNKDYWSKIYSEIVNQKLSHVEVKFNITNNSRNYNFIELFMIKNKIISIFNHKNLINVNIVILSKGNMNNYRISITIEKIFHHSIVSRKNKQLYNSLHNFKYIGSLYGPTYSNSATVDANIVNHTVCLDFVMKK